MMTERKTNGPGFFTMGAPLLLTALFVLMLVTFSILSLSSAREEHRRSELLAARTDGYYAACNRAEAVLDRLRSGVEPGVPLEAEGDQLTFRILITETQSLTVKLRREAEGYTVTGWTVENH